jgi:aryl-alcohol dehydrogenase-like predicted oxidoreductase
VAQGAPGDDGRGDRERWALFEKAGLDDLREPGESRTAFLLRFTLSHPDLHTTIVGTLMPAHLDENRRIAERGPLPASVYAEAKRRLDAAGVTPA